MHPYSILNFNCRLRKADEAIKKFRLDAADLQRLSNERTGNSNLTISENNTCTSTLTNHLVKIGSNIAYMKKLGLTCSLALDDELKKLSSIKHENVNEFLGVCLESSGSAILMKYASRGSLYDILNFRQDKLSLDMKQSILLDVALGMNYLHKSNIGKSKNYLVLLLYTSMS